MSSVTFIVPTVGRPTLSRALQSLVQQTDPDWRALVICDGVQLDHADLPADARISFLHIPKTGTANHAGEVRNLGVDFCKGHSEWVAFVDDDDSLSPLYLARLRQHAQEHPDRDCVVFRMHDPRHAQCLPPPDHGTLCEGYVGISFAFRPANVPDHSFRPSRIEDFDLLTRMQAAGTGILVSPYVAYFVRTAPDPSADEARHRYVLINFATSRGP